MTNQILFLIAIMIGAFYARKYGIKAKSDIENYNQKKTNETVKTKNDYLNTNVFYNLKNMNNGFDTESIHYFSQSDFEIIINRIEELGIGILGIEPWLNGEFYDIKVVEDYGGISTDSKWYRKAFEEFKKENENLLYAASYDIQIPVSF
ncbi:hypothetical protein IRZ71_08275 [Flavobacterium sp. ANB]|uniref:hypothetical protein n=1 Tax=unclassified Flavobacterium TaxID=196869 RepID=UPI0012B76A83|nr:MULTISPECIES: hypothetical protein [unclassified Flavobacterium]MBF4516335.1 hypothetical protein [Flavobacterium sp. ANB]MTD69768.1 hypothetical protein [Flavobacterium sp. LC2016-13]